MSTAIISSKGQITLPVSLRQAMGIKPHDKVVIEAHEDGILVRLSPDFKKWAGFLGKARPRETERAHMTKFLRQRLKGAQ